MVNKKKIVGLILFLIILLIVFLYYEFIIIKRWEFQYAVTAETLYNPMMGFAPSADYEDAVGENTLVYVDITWREWEPQEGIFDPQSIIEDNNLTKWRELGKKVVLRFVCDIPDEEEHMDIPDWLYEKTGDGTTYDFEYGRGYSPDYKNQMFIDAHEKAIVALGDEFGQDSFVCYVELGSLGHWGEWHVKYDEGIPRIPNEEVCLAYVKPYIEAFPKAKLLMRRPYGPVTTYGFGVYNDMVGDEEDTLEWLRWIENGGSYDEAEKPLKLIASPEIWEKRPIGGEFTSSNTMEEMLVSDVDKTVELLQESHMTFIGPKCPIANKEAIEYPEGTSSILQNVGYRYGVRYCKREYNSLTGAVTLKLLFENSGTAPMYFQWPVYIYLIDDENNVESKVPVKINLNALLQNETKEVTVIFNGINLGKKLLSAGIGIEDPETGEPAVSLNMECETDKKIYLLYRSN